MSHHLSDPEISELIIKARTGDNAAWERICENFDRYIHECAWKRLRKLDLEDAYRKDLEEDLYMAGWQGFVSAIKNCDPERGKLLTYATHYIDGEISKELDILLNPLGLVERPKAVKNEKGYVSISKVSLDMCQERMDPFDKIDRGLDIPDTPAREKYNAERRALQILEVLRIITDEDHPISKDKLGRMLRIYRIAKYGNGIPLESPNTLTSTLESILQELDPMEYSEDNDDDYRIKYEGYKEDRLKQKLSKAGGKKAADMQKTAYGRDKIVALLGNHEEFALSGEWPIGEDRAGNVCARDDDKERCLAWMETLPRYRVEGNTIFVHAGIDEEAGEWSVS